MNTMTVYERNRKRLSTNDLWGEVNTLEQKNLQKPRLEAK